MSAEIIAIIGLLGTICGILGYLGGKKKEAKAEGKTEASMRSDIEYIKRRSDDTLLEVKDTNKQISSLTERVTRVEESTKQAHKRIDRLEEV